MGEALIVDVLVEEVRYQLEPCVIRVAPRHNRSKKFVSTSTFYLESCLMLWLLAIENANALFDRVNGMFNVIYCAIH